MKRFTTFLFVFSLLIPSVAFASPDPNDLVEIEIDGVFISDGILKIEWEIPSEEIVQFNYFELFKSETDSTPREDSIVKGTQSTDITEEPSDGVTFYQMCVETVSQTMNCSKTLAVHGQNNNVLEPIIEKFDDIEGHWGETYIEKLRVLNVVQGRGEDAMFEPNSDILRAEAIKVMMLAFGIGGVSCHSDYFPDMDVNDWFCDVVSKAYQDEYVEGDQGYLYPGREITRAEAVKVVLGILDIDVEDIEVPSIAEKPFDDVEIDQWYSKYIAKAKELNLVQGVGDGLFEPNRSITRAELSKIASKAANL